MSNEAGDSQRRYREFLDLMPLTLALAGLPLAELGKNFNEDQIEVRVYTLRHAYRAARQFAREMVQGGEHGGRDDLIASASNVRPLEDRRAWRLSDPRRGFRSFPLAQSASFAETRGGEPWYSLDEAQGVECPTMQRWFNAV